MVSAVQTLATRRSLHLAGAKKALRRADLTRRDNASAPVMCYLLVLPGEAAARTSVRETISGYRSHEDRENAYALSHKQA
jgi:hypothetical protein